MKLNHRDCLRAARGILPAFVFLAAAALSIQAQNPGVQNPETQNSNASKQSPDVQELKDRVQQLEQTIEELKQQIGAVETAKKPATVDNPAPVDQPPSAPPVSTTPVDKPKQDDSKGESTFEIYGFVMLDAGYQWGQNDPAWFDVIRPTKLPAFRDQFAPNGKTYWGVRQSRFGVRSSTPTDWGELKTQFEFELFGTGVDAGQTTFRLRHAYGELGQFGAGQTWSPFMDIDVFPNSIEYWGPNGMVFFRNVQARWMPIKGRSRVTIALERPGASADQGNFADRIELQGVRPKFEFPDLSWEARYGKDWGYVEIAGILRQLKWRDTNDDGLDLGGSDLGWGLNLSSNINFTKNDIGRFQIVYGEGIQNYMNDAPTDVGIENNFDDPNKPIKGVALPVLGIVAFLDHNWNKKFSSTIGYSFMNIENSSGQTNDAFHRGHYGLTNLLFYPVENVMIGGEFQWGRRENWRDGFGANDYRMQFSVRYNFSKIFRFNKDNP